MGARAIEDLIFIFFVGPLRRPSALAETGRRVLLTSQPQLSAPQPTDVPMRALERVLKPCVRSWPDVRLTTVQVVPLGINPHQLSDLTPQDSEHVELSMTSLALNKHRHITCTSLAARIISMAPPTAIAEWQQPRNLPPQQWRLGRLWPR